MRNKQGITIAALIIAIVGLSIGFAAFSNTLTIRSSATVNPDQSALRVVFSLDDDSEVVGTTGSVTPNSNTYGDAGTINNATQGQSLISGLHAKFTEPGQSVKYNVSSANLYVYNAGSLQAQLTGVTFNNAQNASTYKKCTAVTENKQESEIATDALVQAACADITISVKVGNKVATPQDTSLNYQILGVGASLPAEITITYGGSTYVDGDFEVAFGDVVINATSAVDETLVVTPQEPDILSDFIMDSTGTIISYTGNDTDVVIPSTLPVYNIVASVDMIACGNSDMSEYCNEMASAPASQLLTLANYYDFISISYVPSGESATVLSIGERAFLQKGITSIIIPDSVTTIGDYAFLYNNLTTVQIGTSSSNLSSIGEYAFDDDALEHGLDEYEGPTLKNNIQTLTIYAHENDVTVGNNAFSGFVGTIDWVLDRQP